MISNKDLLKGQILKLQQMLFLASEDPFMSKSLSKKISKLQEKLEEVNANTSEAKLSFLFSGNAVSGSQGIKSTFISKIMPSIQGLVKAQLAVNKYGKVGSRGRTRKKANNDLYLTALPRGSFGIELSQLDTDENDLYDIVDTSEAMKDVILLVKNVAESDESFETVIQKTSKRNLNNLKKFLNGVSSENSILKMDSGDLHIELSNGKVNEAATRVSSTVKEEDYLFIDGTLRGILLDSNKFDILDLEGHSISGSINNNIDEDQLIEYDKKFLNKECVIHLKINKTKFTTGNEKTEYELLEIKEKEAT